MAWKRSKNRLPAQRRKSAYQPKEVVVTITMGDASMVEEWEIKGCTAVEGGPCHRSWDSLIATDRPRERFCDECGQTVYRVYDKQVLAAHEKAGHCVAYSPRKPWKKAWQTKDYPFGKEEEVIWQKKRKKKAQKPRAR